jgi:hypothetical protein
MRAGREVRARRFEHQHHQNIIIPTPTISLTNQRNHLHHQRRQRRTKSVDNIKLSDSTKRTQQMNVFTTCCMSRRQNGHLLPWIFAAQSMHIMWPQGTRTLRTVASQQIWHLNDCDRGRLQSGCSELFSSSSATLAWAKAENAFMGSPGASNETAQQQ